MNKLTILFFLGVITIVSCAIFNEKKIQKKIDEKLPGFMQGPAKAVVHKFAKMQYACVANMDTMGNCEQFCQATEEKKGYCHGTKCKCGIPLSYK